MTSYCQPVVKVYVHIRRRRNYLHQLRKLRIVFIWKSWFSFSSLKQTKKKNAESRRRLWYATLCVSRNLLISLEIKSLLSSSISMALMSSSHEKEKEQKEEPTKHPSTGDKSAASGRAAASHWRTSSFFSFLFLLRGWLSESWEGALSSLAYSLIRTSMAPLMTWSLLSVSSSRTSSSSSSVFDAPPASCVDSGQLGGDGGLRRD